MGHLSVDSSPSSAESSFRELDEVFLRTQTRMWLGEVLGKRLDEDLHISDLLQDGEILYDVSKVIWNLLVKKCMELKHLKHKYCLFGSRKSGGRYRPYSNVDSFIKICKILGLSDIDLFSPSDVVEKRDIRKVCICIRALSKKSRCKQLSVPDFDVVMHSVAIPMDMVGGIQRSLESSPCTISSSSTYNSHKGCQMEQSQENLSTPSSRDDEFSSDESDEAESRYMGENSFSSVSKSGDDDGVNFDLVNLPGEFSTFGRFRKQDKIKSCVKCQSTNNNTGCQSACSTEALQLFSPKVLEKDNQLDEVSSCRSISHKSLYHGIGQRNYETMSSSQNGDEDVSETNFVLENEGSVMGDTTSSNDFGESDYISDYLAFSDFMVHASGDSHSAMFQGENNMFDFFLNVNSQGIASDRMSFHSGSQKKYSDDEDEDMEVSSTTSMSSVLGRMFSLEFDDHCDSNESSTVKVYSSRFTEHGADKHNKDTCILSDTPKEGTFGTPLHKTISENHPCCLPVKDMNANEDDRIAHNIHHHETISSSSVQTVGSQDEGKDGPDTLAENVVDEKMIVAPEKHVKRRLVKTVIRGTAIAGVLLFLLQIRKSRGDNTQETKPTNQFPNYRKSNFTSGKQQTGISGKGVYPAEKLKLSN